MTTAKWTINAREQQDLPCPPATFNGKGCSLVWGGDALRPCNSALPLQGINYWIKTLGGLYKILKDLPPPPAEC
jgi:hypothetical protein